jgi:hypothetical protein
VPDCRPVNSPEATTIAEEPSTHLEADVGMAQVTTAHSLARGPEGDDGTVPGIALIVSGALSMADELRDREFLPPRA